MRHGCDGSHSNHGAYVSRGSSTLGNGMRGKPLGSSLAYEAQIPSDRGRRQCGEVSVRRPAFANWSADHDENFYWREGRRRTQRESSSASFGIVRQHRQPYSRRSSRRPQVDHPCSTRDCGTLIAPGGYRYATPCIGASLGARRCTRSSCLRRRWRRGACPAAPSFPRSPANNRLGPCTAPTPLAGGRA